jgi:hypothetical protein
MVPINTLIKDRLINLNKIVPAITPNNENGAMDHTAP